MAKLIRTTSTCSPAGAPTSLPAAKEILPDAYSSMAVTTLTASVPAGGGTVDFPLAGKKK